MGRAIKRLAVLWVRNRRARRLGFTFGRAASFALPPAIQMGSRPLTLSLPNDGGTKTSFVDIMLDDCYRLRELPADIHTVADVGCHAGLFSIAARNRWPHAVIHAYEPNPALKCHWAHHAAAAGFVAFQEAVGVTAGTVRLLAHEDSVQVRAIECDSGAITQVPFEAVLARLGGAADLVKLDCEGAEWLILQDRASWERTRFLTMEFHLWAGYTLDQLRERLATLDFRIRSLAFAGPDFGILVADRGSCKEQLPASDTPAR